MQIRTATEFDTAKIAQLHATSWRVAYRGMLSDAYLEHQVERDRLSLWQERLSKPISNQRILVAEQEHELVAFVCWYGANDPKWGTLVDNLHVHQSLQRRGIGALLMTEVASWCCQTYPNQGIYLWVLQANQPAQAFYDRLGARNAESDIWSAPDGESIPILRLVWSHPKVLANGITNIID